jgi:DNA helicase-2/ATP-dependent DNA helicase PcrA
MSLEYLDELNEAQKQAVINSEGPALVIAGAGAGKTRVLTYRIAHLLNKGVEAGSILSLTFTNKAAGEMRDRIISLAGYNNARFLWMGTFHSIFARILRSESDKLGYPSTYTIYDTTDSRSLIKTIIREMNLDDKVYKPAGVAARISAAKNNLITASAYLSNSEIVEKDRSAKVPHLSEIYKIYAARCFKAGAMDFDDLLLNTNILFRDFPEVLQKYRERFRYILVDEYQDTNYSQYLIINKLSESHRNICVVGDDAQSIYSFRGARIENILNFRKDYPDYKLYKLEQNYRSTKTIVKAANSVIHKNQGQIKKTIFSEKSTGDKIRVIRSMTDAEEGFKIASDIFDRSLRQQLNWSNFAILYRTNAQSRIFEETLRKRNIPYKIYGGQSFFERKEIKDILAYFRMLVNPKDEEALKRTINYPKRGIGKTTVDRIFEAANKHEVPAWAIISHPDKWQALLTGATWKRIAVYAELINRILQSSSNMNAYDLAVKITSEAGIKRDLAEGRSPEEISRYENFQELLNAVKEFTESAETNGEPDSLEAYLETVALLTDQDTDGEADINKVTLMTVHSAKGLEYSQVYVVGLEENLFPSLMAMGTNKEVEEERRLFYVAITRAMEGLTLSYAENRYKWGNLEICKPSMFLSEISEEFLDMPGHEATRSVIKDSYRQRPQKNYGKSTWEKQPEYKPHGKKKLTNISSGKEKSENFEFTTDLEKIVPGLRVSHERFGSGEVILIDGRAPNTTALVRFDSVGEKKLLLRFAKLAIIN